ncbi:MAG TPA: hypothetical protein VMT50_12335 [Steroidobacteraceae bacterium]|nr:hypothetical protein [Steroidobacteraceae bacterium]
MATGAATRVELPCGRVPQCTPGSAAWCDDGSTLAFALRIPGRHEYSLYSVAPDGRRLTRVLEFKGTLTSLRFHHGTLAGNSLHWVSPPELFVYEYDWLPDGSGFVGTASPGDGDSTVSPDGRSIAFIAGIMSGFGSTGGDVFSVPFAGGTAVDLAPAMPASARALGWSCAGTLQAVLLADDRQQLVDLGAGTAPRAAAHRCFRDSNAA